MVRVYVHSFAPGELPWCIDRGEPELAECFQDVELHGDWRSCLAVNFDPKDRETKPRCWFETESGEIAVDSTGTAHAFSVLAETP